MFKESWVVRASRIKLPTEITEDLAELIGIHIGDGSACEMKDTKTRKNGVSLSYTFNSLNDIDYYDSHVRLLFKRVFGIEPTTQPCGNWFEARLYHEPIFLFLTKVIGLPIGKKTSSISMPKILEKYPIKFKFRCLRGIADTDATLTFKKKYRKMHYYPVIKLDLSSKKLINNVAKLLISAGFKIYKELNVKTFLETTGKIYTKHVIYVSGKKNLKLWMKLIGFKNFNNLSKYLIWKKFGFCPPKLTVIERKLILENKINPESFYN